MILIIDDRIEVKIGDFEDALVRAGFSIEKATTLEEAMEAFEKNIDDIDAVILDYSFPVSESNHRVYDDNKVPNGIVFLTKYEMKMHLKGIPIIINTDSDDDYREKWLKKSKYFSDDSNILYKSLEKQPLSFVNAIEARRIIEKINESKEIREIAKKVQPTTKKWPRYLLDQNR